MQVDPQVVTQAATRFGLTPGTLQHVSSSEGELFRAHGETDHALKLTPVDDQHEGLIRDRWAFVAYLAENGVAVAQPLPSPTGNIIEWIDGPERRWAAVALPWFEGHPLEPLEFGTVDAAVLEAWGRTLGQMHALTKRYDGGACLPQRIEEAEGMLGLCREPSIRRAWETMITALGVLPRGVDDYGLVHNDLHTHNILVQDGTVRVIDFDVCVHHWFACDLAITQQCELWIDPSRMPERRRLWKRAFDHLWAGYGQANRLDPVWLQQLGLFLDYRRLLLYAVFHQEWRRSVGWQRALLNRWRAGIESGRPVVENPWWL